MGTPKKIKGLEIMMDFNMLVEYAGKGIMADIRKHEKTVRDGKALLRALDKGQRIKSPLNYEEIVDIVEAAHVEIKKLSDMEIKLRNNAIFLEPEELYEMYNPHKPEA